jgi:hypothetical protein
MNILNWYNNNKKKAWKIILLFSVAFFLLVLFLSFNVFFKKNNLNQTDLDIAPKENQKESVCSDCSPRAIDGVEVKNQDSNRFPFAVMIDNHPDARPAYGLAQANLVIEAEAEGGITRYLALFASNEVIPKIGPIRSIRPYFLEWAEEINPLVVHCGGSPEALAMAIKDKVYDLNEFYNGKFFWRDEKRSAPHNVFTSSKKINEYLEAKKLYAGEYLSWQYSREITEGEPKNMEIKINFFSSVVSSFEVVWKYDIIKNIYIRYLNGEKQVDGDGGYLESTNIVIQYAEKEVIDEKLRLDIKTIGSGQAVFCKLGRCNAGFWEKESKTSRTKFYLPDKKEYDFFPGTTWIEVVNKNIPVNY